jgi:hypothetical protein
LREKALTRALGFALTFAAVALCALASSAAADTTIGADVNQSPATSGTCGFDDSDSRPCLILDTGVPGRTTASPCDGTVVAFRLNGHVTTNTFHLRVVRDNHDGTFTGTATSAPVSIQAEGVNAYSTNLPISTGQYIGIDFADSTTDHSLRWVNAGPGVGAVQHYFLAFPSDGGPAPPSGTEPGFYYLYNADVACSTLTTPPGQGQPAAQKCKKKKKKKNRDASAAKKKKGCKKKKKRK